MDKIGYSIYLSERVEELINEGTLDEILSLVKAEIEGEWASTAPLETPVREAIYHELHALNRVDIRIKAILSNLTMQRNYNG